MFLDTQPLDVGQLASRDGGLDEFRIHAPIEVRALLRKLVDGNVLVNVSGSDGTAYTTTIWAIDHARGTLSLSADAADPKVQRLIEAEEAVVVGYLDSIKVQFDLHGLVLVHGVQTSALQASLPREIYRFQRRSSYRVRPLGRTTPLARLHHPALPEMQLQLRILDVSLGGCALFVPADVPPISPGVDIASVWIELDPDTRFETRLHIHHVTSLDSQARGVRLGCSMVALPREAERMLQRYIDQTQKRRRLLSLD